MAVSKSMKHNANGRICAAAQLALANQLPLPRLLKCAVQVYHVSSTI